MDLTRGRGPTGMTRRARHPSRFISIAGSCLAGLCLAGMAAPLWADSAVLPSVKARAPRHVEARPAGMPSDAELAAQGARIGEITINSRPLFDTSGPDQNTALFRLANKLHIQTRDATIEEQLLFHRGDPYNGQQLAETGRILRDTR